MNSQPNTPTSAERHRGPNLGAVTTIFTVLFLVGLCPVTMFGGAPYFPGPSESTGAIVSFFQMRGPAVLLCFFFHFGAAIALGIFTASAVSQLHFLGVRAAGAYIALFGGLATAFKMGASASVLWVMARGIRSRSSSLRRAELAKPDLPEGAFFHSPDEVPWLYLADRNWIPVAKGDSPASIKHCCVRSIILTVRKSSL